MSTNLAFGAGGPQRRKSIPTAARLAQLRHRAIKARMQGLGSGRREGRTLLAVDQDVPQIINERTSRNLANTFPFVGGNRGLPRDILSLRHICQRYMYTEFRGMDQAARCEYVKLNKKVIFM